MQWFFKVHLSYIHALLFCSNEGAKADGITKKDYLNLNLDVQLTMNNDLIY